MPSKSYRARATCDVAESLPFFRKPFPRNGEKHAHADRLFELGAIDQLVELYAPAAWGAALGAKRRNPDFYNASVEEMASDALIALYDCFRREKNDSVAKCLAGAKLAMPQAIHRAQLVRLGVPLHRAREQSIIRSIRRELIAATGIVPTDQEVSQRLAGVFDNPQLVVERDRKRNAAPRVVHSSDEAIDPITPVQRAIDRDTIALALKGLAGIDRQIFELLLKGVRQAEIARRLNLSRQRINQRLNGVLWEARSRADLARNVGVAPAPKATVTRTAKLFSPIPGRRLMVG